MLTKEQNDALRGAGWVPISSSGTLFINENLFERGIISFLDPNGYDFAQLEGTQEFSVNQSRKVRVVSQQPKLSSPIETSREYLNTHAESYDKEFKEYLQKIVVDPALPLSMGNLKDLLEKYKRLKRAFDRVFNGSVLKLQHKKFQKSPEFVKALTAYLDIVTVLDRAYKNVLEQIKLGNDVDLTGFIQCLKQCLAAKEDLDKKVRIFLDSYSMLEEETAEQGKFDRIAKEFFGTSYHGMYLRNVRRMDEYYIPVVVRNSEDEVISALYIHPQKIGEQLASEASASSADQSPEYTSFHAETCMIGSQFKCLTNADSTRCFLKHDVRFFDGERIVKILSQSADNSYERMQFEDLRLMAVQMRAFSRKNSDGEPLALVTHHLPWLDYILSGVLLFEQAKMEYPALLSLCQLMISKKIEHEEKIIEIYRAQGLSCNIVSPFDNLLNPAILITAESVLKQLDVENPAARSVQESLLQQDLSPDLLAFLNMQLQAFNLFFKPEQARAPLADITENLFEALQKSQVAPKKFNEQAFVEKYLSRLLANSFYPEQQALWISLAEAKLPAGEAIVTFDDLLGLANPLVMMQSASGADDNPRPCSFVSTQAKTIQIKYGTLNRANPGLLPAVTCFASVPTCLTTSHRTTASTFYFDYAPHAELIKKLLQQALVDGAIHNMSAFLAGTPAKPLSAYLSSPNSQQSNNRARSASDTDLRDARIVRPVVGGYSPAHFQPPTASGVVPSLPVSFSRVFKTLGSI